MVRLFGKKSLPMLNILLLKLTEELNSNVNQTVLSNLKIEFDELAFNFSDERAFPGSIKINVTAFDEKLQLEFLKLNESHSNLASDIYTIGQSNNNTAKKHISELTEVNRLCVLFRLKMNLV
jgi:hypothetical protein